MKEPITLSTASLALLTSAFWGGVVVAVKYSEDTLAPGMVASIRFGLAGCFMLIWCRISGVSLGLNRREARLALIIACLLLVQILLFNSAIHLSNSSHGALLISSFVIWVALIDHFVTRGDAMSSRKVLGMGLAGIGVACTLLAAEPTASDALQPRPHDPLLKLDMPTIAGDLLMICSSIMLGIKVVFTKYAVGQMDSQKLIFWHHVLGTGLFLMYVGLFEGLPTISHATFTGPVVMALLYQGLVVGGFCFAVQAALLRRHSATAIAVFGFATPVFGVIAALFFRGDPFSGWLLVAGVCVAAGIYLANRPA